MAFKELQHVHHAAPIVPRALRAVRAQPALHPRQHRGEHVRDAEERLDGGRGLRGGEPGEKGGRSGDGVVGFEGDGARRRAGENVVEVGVDEGHAALQRGEEGREHAEGQGKRGTYDQEEKESSGEASWEGSTGTTRGSWKVRESRPWRMLLCG